MGDPYLIFGPAVISFSGGRSSGYKLKHILDAHGGQLPPDVHVAFANTGKEMPETLDFVQECSERWGVQIAWLEYDPDAPHRTKVVDYATASRKGEPYEAIIRSKRILPNPLMRFCTIEGKIKRIQAYAKWTLGFSQWKSVVGLRADEPRRLAKVLPDRVTPLADAGVVRADILAWWAQQPFDLELPLSDKGETEGGNCDLCFLKGRANIDRLVSRRPALADWWIEREEDPTLARGNLRNESIGNFRADRPSYRAIRDHAVWVQSLRDERARRRAQEEADDGSVDCACTD